MSNVIIRNAFTQSCQYTFNASGFGAEPRQHQGNAQASPDHSGHPRQPEADHQHFKGHTIVDVAEGRAIKIKPHRLFRAIVAILKPEKLRILVDKTPYKPVRWQACQSMAGDA